MTPHDSAQRISGALWILSSAAAFGALAIFARYAFAHGMTVPTLLFLRFAIAGAVMACYMLVTRAHWPRGRVLATLLLMGGVGYVGQSWCYFTALQHASAGLTALLLYLYPVIVTLLMAAAGRLRLTRFRLIAVATAFFGTALTIGGSVAGSPLGIALGLGAAFIYSIYIITGERATAAAGAIPAATVVMLAAGVVNGGIALAQGPAWPASAQTWTIILAIALLSTAFAVVGFFAGVRRIGAADGATLSTLEPVVTIALAALLLGETIGPWQLAGGALILAAVIALVRGGRHHLLEPQANTPRSVA
jgi:drug/metabolite transporter (DMT)-like permease